MVYAPVRPDPALPPVRVNLFSDTQTRPSAAMKDWMMRAEVGDEQNGDDPTVNALCDRMAELTGKQAALFLPSGTMCNQISILVHCQPGDEILAHEDAHIIASEGGGPGALAGAVVLGLRGARGMFDSATIRAALREKRRNAPPQTLVAVEQTANAGGGSVWPLPLLSDVLTTAHEHDMKTHMDGARLMNAVIGYRGDSRRNGRALRILVWLDFTKGLGAPLGAVLVRVADVHRRSLALEAAAWRFDAPGGDLRRRLPLRVGPQCRPARGRSCQRPCTGRAACPRWRDWRWRSRRQTWSSSTREGAGLTADALAERVRQLGISVSTVGPYRVRACTHLDVDAEGVALAVKAIAEAVR